MSDPIKDATYTNGARRLRISNNVLIISVVAAVFFIFLGLKQNSRLERENAAIKQQKSADSLMGDIRAQPGDLLPPFEAFDLEGRRIAVSYDGTSRHLLYFFSSQCETCLSQLSIWNQIAKRAKAQRDIVLGVSSDSPEVTRSRIGSQGFDVVAIEDMAVFRAYRVEMIPMVVLTSPLGRVEWLHYGPITQGKTKELLSRMDSNGLDPSTP